MTDTGAIVRRVLVDGSVQGVGYREFTRRAALNLGVTGWVRNRTDGAVEALIRGPRAAVEALVAEMRKGPQFATVNSVSRDRTRRNPWRRQRRIHYPANGIAQMRRERLAWLQPRRGGLSGFGMLRLRPFGAAGGVRRVGRRIAGGERFFQLLVELLFMF